MEDEILLSSGIQEPEPQQEAEVEADMEPEQDVYGQEEELEREAHQRRQVSTCRQKSHPSCHPAEGGRTLSANLEPNKNSGREEPEEEQKYPLSRKQT